MLLTDSERARAAFYGELTGVAKGASSEAVGEVAARFEKAVVVRTEAQIGLRFKRGLIIAITAIFIASVIAMWTALYLLFSTEVDLLRAKIIAPADRIIDSKVAITLIGATVVEIAIAFGLIAKNLFGLPANSADELPANKPPASQQRS